MRSERARDGAARGVADPAKHLSRGAGGAASAHPPVRNLDGERLESSGPVSASNTERAGESVMIQLELWSDLLCPYCYIGKRHLEAALARFEHANEVQTVWKSFQLDPQAPRLPQSTSYDRLAKKYGQSTEWARRMTEQVAHRAALVGLRFDFDHAVPTNSLDAHRLIHLAARRGLQDAAAEHLFAAHFTEGRNIGDPGTLEVIGAETGLDPADVHDLLEGNAYRDEVEHEGQEARSLGVTGVPFFLLDRKYAVAGAQPVELFVKALRSAWQDRNSEFLLPAPALGSGVP